MSADISELEFVEYYKPNRDHHYKVLGVFDIKKSKSTSVALIAVNVGRVMDMRLYKLISRHETWKVDLSRMFCDYWNGISYKLQILKEKFNKQK